MRTIKDYEYKSIRDAFEREVSFLTSFAYNMEFIDGTTSQRSYWQEIGFFGYYQHNQDEVRKELTATGAATTTTITNNSTLKIPTLFTTGRRVINPIAPGAAKGRTFDIGYVTSRPGVTSGQTAMYMNSISIGAIYGMNSPGAFQVAGPTRETIDGTIIDLVNSSSSTPLVNRPPTPNADFIFQMRAAVYKRYGAAYFLDNASNLKDLLSEYKKL
jgi:hypothetical protein